MRIRSISTKILLVTLLLSVASAAISAFLLYQQSRKTYVPVTEQMLQNAANASAETITRRLDSAFTVSENIQQMVTAAKNQGMTDRAVISSMLEKVLKAHPELLGVYSVWEPNAFDGKDSEFVGKSCHDQTGRMLMYWNRGSGEAKCEPVVDYDCKESRCDWYNLPRQNKRPTAIEPFSYVVGGQNILLTSLIAPDVQADGTSPGFAGADLALTDVRKDVEALRPIQGSSAVLLSARGNVMASPNKETLNKPYAYRLKEILDATSADKSLQFQQETPEGLMYITTVPIRVGKSNERYTLLLAAPAAQILSPLVALRNYSGFIGLFTAGMLALLLFTVLRRTVVRPINQAVHAATDIAGGNLATSIPEGSGDETGTLLRSLNTMRNELSDRIEKERETTESIRRENEQLNNSVVEIMTGVAQLAQRDLTVRVPVSEDVTGAVSDAINMMTSSTARALREVNRISQDVSSSSARVKERADVVQSLANNATVQANAASGELNNTALALRQIGEQANIAGQDAVRALAATGDALKVVGETVNGITASRDQIRETEKRVKRLAERSQEISSVVSIIGQIAERTSVLALNASMQAVAAGDAGRGFAVVADEVKRLAENSRDATQQIAALVGAIQADTSETLQAMNGTITQVVDITRLADRAGTQMTDTLHATEALANSVRLIQQTTDAQTEASQRLLTRAYELISASQKTLEEIDQQRTDTESLNTSASDLVSTVSDFQLPTS